MRASGSVYSWKESKVGTSLAEVEARTALKPTARQPRRQGPQVRWIRNPSDVSGIARRCWGRENQQEDRENLTSCVTRSSTFQSMLYGFNFNRPVGRVNLLRAYDVLSNAFSLIKPASYFEYAPNVEAGRRLATIDLQWTGNRHSSGKPGKRAETHKYTGTFFRRMANTLRQSARG